MVITLLCGLCSKLDPDGTVIGESTLGWTLVVVNVVVIIFILLLELIRRVLSVVRGVRSGISYMKSTETMSSSGMKSYEGEFRLSAGDIVHSVAVLVYPIHTYPNARSVHSKLVTLGEAEHLCQVYAFEVERGLLYVATPTHTTTLHEHTAKFQTCPMAVQDFARSVIEGLHQLHSMDIAHGNIRPETILLDGGKLAISDFSHARLVNEGASSALRTDIEMAASTILFALSGGLAETEMNFGDLLETAKTEFAQDTIAIFDGIRAGRLEAIDLLRAMIAGTPLLECLDRPFFWSRDKTAAYLGEEIGNLLDPQATKDSPHYPFIEALEARGALELGGAYDEIRKQDGPSWAALLDPDYPLAEAKSASDPTGWGASRSAQQPPADAEHCYAVYGKNPSAKQKAAREDKLKSGKKAPMVNRRMVGLLKMIRNVAFAHRSQNVQV
jgi:tRNA A-37 threonylcarbamoyl transferase component Bud32